MEIEQSIFINASAEKVFEFMTDLENAPSWRVGLLEAKQVSPGEMQAGTIVEEKVNVLGREVSSKLKITEFVKAQKRSFTIQLGPLPIELSESYENTPQGTKLSVRGKTSLTGPQKLMSRPVLGQVKKQLAQELSNVKKALES